MGCWLKVYSFTFAEMHTRILSYIFEKQNQKYRAFKSKGWDLLGTINLIPNRVFPRLVNCAERFILWDNMRNAFLVLSILLSYCFASCQNLKTVDEPKFDWNPGAAGVPNYPMEYSMLSFVNSDSTSISSPTF